MRLPRRYAPLMFGAMQAAVTTGVATAIASLQLPSSGVELLGRWLVSWSIAWIALLPIVLLMAPVLKSMVDAVTDTEAAERVSPDTR